jgi:hypothetical protein
LVGAAVTSPVPFQQLHDFFITLGGAAAALLGLLFVAVSVNARTIVGHEDLRELARQTFINLVAVLLYALFGLLPQPAQAYGLQLVIAAGILVIGTGPRFVRSFVRPAGRVRRVTQVLRFGIVLVLQIGALVVGIELMRSVLVAVSALIGIQFALLLGAARNSWEMLVELGEERRGG